MFGCGGCRKPKERCYLANAQGAQAQGHEYAQAVLVAKRSYSGNVAEHVYSVGDGGGCPFHFVVWRNIRSKGAEVKHISPTNEVLKRASIKKRGQIASIGLAGQIPRLLGQYGAQCGDDAEEQWGWRMAASVKRMGEAL